MPAPTIAITHPPLRETLSELLGDYLTGIEFDHAVTSFERADRTIVSNRHRILADRALIYVTTHGAPSRITTIESPTHAAWNDFIDLALSMQGEMGLGTRYEIGESTSSTNNLYRFYITRIQANGSRATILQGLSSARATAICAAYSSTE